MHELSIAMNIVEIACEEARRQGDAHVEVVHLKVGALSGVVEDALLFAWDLACQDTPIAGCRLTVEAVPVDVRCSACQSESTLAEPLDLRCPRCGEAATEVLRGTELAVTALEIEDG